VRHQTERQRSRFFAGFQQAVKRVQIVTGHDGTSRRKIEYQVSITVIDDVKDVVLIADSSKLRGIVPETGKSPICCSGTRPPAQHPNTASEMRHDGHHRIGDDSFSMVRVEVLHQHVANQVHARPALFPIIAEDGYTNGPARALVSAACSKL